MVQKRNVPAIKLRKKTKERISGWERSLKA
jgi:hypothetical protein